MPSGVTLEERATSLFGWSHILEGPLWFGRWSRVFHVRSSIHNSASYPEPQHILLSRHSPAHSSSPRDFCGTLDRRGNILVILIDGNRSKRENCQDQSRSLAGDDLVNGPGEIVDQEATATYRAE